MRTVQGFSFGFRFIAASSSLPMLNNPTTAGSWFPWFQREKGDIINMLKALEELIVSAHDGHSFVVSGEQVQGLHVSDSVVLGRGLERLQRRHPECNLGVHRPRQLTHNFFERTRADHRRRAAAPGNVNPRTLLVLLRRHEVIPVIVLAGKRPPASTSLSPTCTWRWLGSPRSPPSRATRFRRALTGKHFLCTTPLSPTCSWRWPRGRRSTSSSTVANANGFLGRQ